MFPKKVFPEKVFPEKAFPGGIAAQIIFTAGRKIGGLFTWIFGWFDGRRRDPGRINICNLRVVNSGLSDLRTVEAGIGKLRVVNAGITELRTADCERC